MNIANTIYPAKIFLLGEYSALYGSMALAHPYYGFKSQILPHDSIDRTEDFRGLINYLAALNLQDQSFQQFFDIHTFKKALKEGWHYTSDIPMGYGLGSSGSLCAAIFECFAKTCNEQQSRWVMSQLESYFHLNSSGIDPFICYKKQAYLFYGSGHNQVIKIEKVYQKILRHFDLYLIDSAMSRKVDLYIKIFQSKMRHEKYRDFFHNEYIPLNNRIIGQVTETCDVGPSFCLQESFQRLSALQLELFKEMFPDKVMSFCDQLKASQNAFIKLCGAGGGGFYFLFVKRQSDFSLKDIPFNFIPFHPELASSGSCF